MDARVERVLIAGGGVSGLALATGLARSGIEVEIVESRPDMTVTGIGISVPNNALRMLDAVGVLEETLDAGFVFHEYVICDTTGETIFAFPHPDSSDGVPGYMGISRARLGDILRRAATDAGAQLRLGTTIEDLTNGQDAAEVVLSDGRERAFDLVVGCEGLRSPLRSWLFGEASAPIYTGCACWRAMPKMERRVGAMTKFEGSTTAAGLVPITDEEMYLFHVTPEPGNPYHEPSQWRDLLQDRLAEYTGVVADVRENLPDASEIIYSPLFEVRLPFPWYHERAIVIGDAAHAVVPHLSQGGSQSLEDAVVLTEELTRRPLGEALPAFMSRRFERANHIQSVSLNMLLAEVRGQSVAVDRETRRSQISEGMATVRAYLDQPV